ncbi:MAG: Gfo/Idh/MocA family oxidoreductase [Thermoguttaceae bacterium]
MSSPAKNRGVPHLTRRSFVQGTGVLFAASALSQAMPVARGAYAAGSDTLKVALIGCGGRGTGAVAQALSTSGSVKLWAMADLFADKLELSLASLCKGQNASYDVAAHKGFAGKVEVPPERRFVGFDAYKQAIDSGVDVVILTTAPHFRSIHFAYAVQQGKHAFMEKPVAVDAPGIRRVLAAAEMAKQKNLKVGVGLQRHHDALYEETVKRLRDGAIGDIVYQRAYWNGTGYRIRPGREPGMTEMTYQLRNPYHYTWISGDNIAEQHVHNLDVCNWIKGTHPVSAQGMGGRQVRVGPLFGDIFDHHFVEFTYADGSQLFSQCRHMNGCWNSVAEHVIGTKGKAEVNAGRIETGSDTWRYRGPKTNPYQVEHDRLFEAIRNDKPHNEAETGALSTMTAIMGRMATYSGKVVSWDDAIKSELSLAPDRYDFSGTPPILPDKNGLYACAVPGATKAL